MKWFTSIAVASLAAALGFTSVASADVSFYGRVTAGAEHVDNDKEDDDGTWDFGSRNFATRFGFKGSQDLGNGMEAGFHIERGLGAADDKLARRHTLVYLSGGWGKLTLGNQDNPYMKARNWDQTFLYGGGFGLGSSYRHEGIAYSMSNGPFSLNVLAMADDGDEDSTAMNAGMSAATGTYAAITGANTETSGNDSIDGWILHAGYDFGVAAVNIAHQASNKDYDITTAAGTAARAQANMPTALELGAEARVAAYNNHLVDVNASRDNTAIGFNGSVGAMDWYFAYQTSELNAGGNGYEDNDISSVGGQVSFDMSENDRVYVYYVAHSADRETWGDSDPKMSGNQFGGANGQTRGEDFTETIVGYTRDMGPGLRFIAEYAARDHDLEGNDAGSDWSRLGLVIRYVF